MNHTYKVPIIPQNLSKQETIIQIAEILNHLSNVTDDILKHVSKRVQINENKLSGISHRISRVSDKIEKLTGAKKATQVFSSCKYPASDINQPYISIFSNVEPIDLVRHKVKRKKAVTNDDNLDKLHVYHVKVKNKMVNRTVTGLGEMPGDIECLNDLLLYNSGKNLYKDFVMSDVLDVSRQLGEVESAATSGIGAAPHSIRERSIVTKSLSQTYFYTPNLGEVPALDVPLDLPDLPGIADDLRYDSDLDPGIAPSVTTTPCNLDLPPIEEDHKEPQSKEESTVEIQLPPPPPPLPIGEPPKTPESPQVKPIEIVKSLELLETRNEVQETSSPKVPEFPQLDVHASLMDAIRKAGGSGKAKLKSVNTSTDKEHDSQKTVRGTDLMADLHAKLSLRRKGISGTKKPPDNGMDAGSAMERISSMIPPPIPKTEPNEATTEDEDWED